MVQVEICKGLWGESRVPSYEKRPSRAWDEERRGRDALGTAGETPALPLNQLVKADALAVVLDLVDDFKGEG